MPERKGPDHGGDHMINPLVQIHIDGMSLYSVYGNACLGLRHPQNQGCSRLVALQAIESIGAYLVDSGVITDKIRFEHEKGLTSWSRDYHGF